MITPKPKPKPQAPKPRGTHCEGFKLTDVGNFKVNINRPYNIGAAKSFKNRIKTKCMNLNSITLSDGNNRFEIKKFGHSHNPEEFLLAVNKYFLCNI